MPRPGDAPDTTPTTGVAGHGPGTIICVSVPLGATIVRAGSRPTSETNSRDCAITKRNASRFDAASARSSDSRSGPIG